MRLTSFLAGVSPDIPWHVTAFHKDYRMTDPANTTPAMLVAAAAIGRRNGLRYVYAGNLPGRVGDLRTRGVTRAERCSSSARLSRAARPADATGRCAECGVEVPGRWKAYQCQSPVASHLLASQQRSLLETENWKLETEAV